MRFTRKQLTIIRVLIAVRPSSMPSRLTPLFQAEDISQDEAKRLYIELATRILTLQEVITPLL